MFEIRVTDRFNTWFDGLRDRQGKLRIQVRIDRLAICNLGKHRVLSGGVTELKIDLGLGYRVNQTRVKWHLLNVVIPAKAGIQWLSSCPEFLKSLDSLFRGNDEMGGVRA